jgi:hypothetical protein
MTSEPLAPGLIPDNLLANIKEGNCVLFLGADLPLGYAGAPPSRPELAAALAAKYGLPTDLSWPETAQAYKAKFGEDLNGLITFVADRCSGPQVKPGPLHEAIARAGFRAIVTAWYDDLLERALNAAGCRVNRIVRDTQLAYAQEGERDTIVVKLYGCLSDPGSLVLTTWNHMVLMDRLSRKLEVVTGFCTLRPPLFAGFDLTDAMPMRLYVRASTNMVEDMRRVYAVWPQALDRVQAAWQGNNIELVQADATAFLAALASQLPRAVAVGRGVIHVRRAPYKFLDYYTAEDGDIFCGRDTESQIVTRLLLSYRLFTLFGPSGCGKTSLLLAGVVPRLAAEKYQPIYVRALDDPLAALRQAIATRAGRALADEQANLELRAFLETMLAPTDKLVVILDQFEELFLRVGSVVRAAFFRQLAAALANPTREVRVVFSLREDYLARLDEARDDLPDVLANSRRLPALDRANARVAVTEPAARAGVQVEAALVDALVGSEDRAGQTAGDLVETDGRVPPAALQIVLDRLYRAALPAGHPPGEPPPPDLALTLAAYRGVTYQTNEGEVLAGAPAILAGYLSEGLARLAALTREDGVTPLGADPGLGEAILKGMVTSAGTKEVQTQDEMLDRLEEGGLARRADPADRALVENTRLGLERVRLLRGFERDRVACYELAHDHLAAEVARRLGEQELQAKLARELLRRELDNWRADEKLLIRSEILALIHERREELVRRGPAELELLLRSALATGYEVAYWFERAQAGGVNAAALAQQGLRSASFRTRAAAAAALGQLGERFAAALVPLLADSYPQVRVAAIHALERAQPGGEWRQQLKFECYVPAGRFIMGDDKGKDDEKPAHEVRLDAFYIGRYPVTNAEYARYMADIGRAFTVPAGKAEHPVAEVSWYDARDYAAWAGLRLLTEAEWEKAASWDEAGRSGLLGRQRGHKRAYPWGDKFESGRCNSKEAGVGGTTPVGKYSPQGDSPYGVADMAGNVWEWCADWYDSDHYRKSPAENPTGPADGDWRVVRGGSFYDDKGRVGCCARYGSYPYYRYDARGFRVGASPPLL